MQGDEAAKEGESKMITPPRKTQDLHVEFYLKPPMMGWEIQVVLNKLGQEFLLVSKAVTQFYNLLCHS